MAGQMVLLARRNLQGECPRTLQRRRHAITRRGELARNAITDKQWKPAARMGEDDLLEGGMLMGMPGQRLFCSNEEMKNFGVVSMF